MGMGNWVSHSVTCHPTEVNAPRLNYSYSITGTQYNWVGGVV